MIEEDNDEEDEEDNDGSSPTIDVTTLGPGDGLSTGRKEKPGESRLEQDSGVPAEIVGCRLDIATSNLIKRKKRDMYKYSGFETFCSFE